MKLSQSALLAVLASSLVNAAPTKVNERSTNVAKREVSLAKRENLDRALAQLQEFEEMRSKRAELDHQLSEREYEIVTEILTFIKDTDLAPTIIEYFISNTTTRTIAVTAIVYVIKSGLISLKTLLTYLVNSGLLDTVLTDVLSDCEVYAAVIEEAETVVKSLLSSFLSKREELGLGENDIMTHAQSVELLRRDGLMQPSIFERSEKNQSGLHEEDKRDLESIITNVLESLGNSGLASQVVIALLTDSDFYVLGAELIAALIAADIDFSLSDIISALSSSGIVSDLLSLLLSSDTLSTIGLNVLKAIQGQCDSSSSTTKTTATTKATATTTTVAATTQGTTTTSSTSRTTTTAANTYTYTTATTGTTGTTTTTANNVGTTYTTVAAVSTATSSSTDPCETAVAKREFKRLRLNY